MREIPCVFEHDDDGHATPTPTKGCAWVLRPDLDVQTYWLWCGLPVMISRGGNYWEGVKLGRDDVRPKEFWETSKPDPETGTYTGWQKIPTPGGHEYDPHWLAYGRDTEHGNHPERRHGIYSLVGPGVRGNPHRLGYCELKRVEDLGIGDGWSDKRHDYTLLRDLFEGLAAASRPLVMADGSTVDGFHGVTFKLYQNSGPDREQKALRAQLTIDDFPKAAEDE